MRTVAATRAISIVSRKASNAFTPRAQRTSQRMRPNVLARMTPMERGTLAEAARAERRARDPRSSGAVCAPDDRGFRLRRPAATRAGRPPSTRRPRAPRPPARPTRPPRATPASPRARAPRADDHAVRARVGGLGGVLGRRDPEAERDRHLRMRLRALDHA